MSLARDIADLGSSATKLDTVGSNFIINGGMQVAQRNTSVTGIGASGSAYITHDRWKINVNNTAGRFTMEQSTDAPSGFTNSLKFSCTTADTSIAADEELRLSQHIEAGSCAKTMTGTSDAKQLTLSFYAKADSTKTYVAQILNNKHSGYIHNNRTFTVTSSWQRFTMTFQADTTADSIFDGTLTDAGFSLSFWLHAGSNYTSATLASDWATGTTNRAAGIDSFFDSTSRTFFITGVQLEVGDTATDFEHRTFGDELTRCQRYFCRTYEYGTATGASDTSQGCISSVTETAHNYASAGNFNFPVEMRATPTVTLYSTYNANTTGKVTADATDGTGSAGFIAASRCFLFRSNDSSGVGANVLMRAHATASAEL